MVDFKSQTFFYCYNLGWGEYGVHEHEISFERARQIIAEHDPEVAERWEAVQDGYFEFRTDYYMVSKKMFNEKHWEGSDDY